MKKSPLFVVGYPRSGTTLLTAMLDSHPDVSMFNEPMLIKDMREWGFGFNDCIEGAMKIELLKILRRRNHIAALYDDLALSYAGSGEPISFKETYERLLPVPSGAKIWGEKTPSNLLYMKELFELYPQAIFIHITREPGAVLLSHYYKKLANYKSQPVVCNGKSLEFFARHAMRWNMLMLFAERVEHTLPDSSFVRLKFEDLLKFPEKVLGDLCERIGIPYDASLLNEKLRRANQMLHAGAREAHALLDKPLDISRTQAGKAIPSWVSHIIVKYCKEMIGRLGYAADGSQPSFAERFYTEYALLLQERKIRNRIKRQLESWGVDLRNV